MDSLIKVINRLHFVTNKYNIDQIEFPQVIVIGSQSSGKSSILERIINCDILPKKDSTATKCPIILQLIHDKDLTTIHAKFNESDETIIGENNIKKELQRLTDKIVGISESEITIKLMNDKFPTITMIDLPGIVKNFSDKKSIKMIQQLSENYAKKPSSIILAVSAANCDLANSDSIQISNKVDQGGIRTFHILTKIDLMDEGTNALDLLKNPLFTNRQKVTFIVNRSQKKN